VAEGARLESVFTRKGNVGSNPTLSASLLRSHSRLPHGFLLRLWAPNPRRVFDKNEDNIRLPENGDGGYGGHLERLAECDVS
jgi:hypothetical protein